MCSLTSDDAAAVNICFDSSVFGNRLAEFGPPVRGARPASVGVGSLKRYKASTQGALAPAESCMASGCSTAASMAGHGSGLAVKIIAANQCLPNMSIRTCRSNPEARGLCTSSRVSCLSIDDAPVLEKP